MGLKLKAKYRSLNDLASHLVEHAERDAALFPLTEVPGSLQQYDRLEIDVVCGDERGRMEAEVVQVLPGVGIVAHITDPGPPEELVAYATFSDSSTPPVVDTSFAFIIAEDPPVVISNILLVCPSIHVNPVTVSPFVCIMKKSMPSLRLSMIA